MEGGLQPAGGALDLRAGAHSPCGDERPDGEPACVPSMGAAARLDDALDTEAKRVVHAPTQRWRLSLVNGGEHGAEGPFLLVATRAQEARAMAM